MLNLNETLDIHYRYKMPSIESVTESSGNGIKTALKNISKVARAIARPPEYVTKFLSLELGCICKWDEKADRYILMGQHDNERLQSLIYTFIKKFVLCTACNNPETAIVVGGSAKRSSVSLLCSACGASSECQKSRLVGYIAKNPPSEEFNPITHGQGEQNGDQESSKRNSKKDSNSDSDDDIPAIGPSSEKEKSQLDAEMRNLLERAKKDSIDLKMQKFEDSLRPHLSVICEKSTTLDSGLIRGLASYAVELEIRSSSPVILAKNLFKRETSDQPSDLTAYITPSWTNILSVFLLNHTPSQVNFLIGLEEIMCKPCEHPFNFKGVPNLAMWLYQNDLVSEESFTTWYGRFSSSIPESESHGLDKSLAEQLFKSMQPFIDWLNQSSEEESDDKNEDDHGANEKVVNGDASNRNDNSVVNTTKLKQTNEESNHDEESDIDIDDI